MKIYYTQKNVRFDINHAFEWSFDPAVWFRKKINLTVRLLSNGDMLVRANGVHIIDVKDIGEEKPLLTFTDAFKPLFELVEDSKRALTWFYRKIDGYYKFDAGFDYHAFTDAEKAIPEEAFYG